MALFTIAEFVEAVDHTELIIFFTAISALLTLLMTQRLH